MNNKKIAILSLPMRTNYGGILQAYALQQILIKQGYCVEHLSREADYVSYSLPCCIKSYCKYYLRKILHKKNLVPTPSQSKFISKHTNKFINDNINLSPSLYSDKKLIDYFSTNNFDILIVGSDQVWRPSMCINPLNYFLDFARYSNVKKISYAASFGVDSWEYNANMTQECRKLIHLFDAISVREKSGLSLCKENLNVDAQFVLDPTLLLDRTIYEKIVVNSKEPCIMKKLFCYILDDSPEKNELIRFAERDTGMASFKCMPFKAPTPENIELWGEECVYPSVTQWLRSFIDSEMVITDSYHGVIFSIIFNRPMWIVGNKKRGLARINSVLSLFGLQERLISNMDKKNVNWRKEIDWDTVNSIKSDYCEKSKLYLFQSLL